MIDISDHSLTPLSTDDSFAIQRLVHRYADAVVHRDAEQWGACWNDEAVWNLGRGRGIVGKAAIVDLWRKAMAGMDAVVQFAHNGDAWRVDADNDAALGRWYISERFRRSNGDVGVLLAHYDDAYVRTQRGWRFSRRLLQAHYHGPPDLSDDFLNTAARLSVANANQKVED